MTTKAEVRQKLIERAAQLHKDADALHREASRLEAFVRQQFAETEPGPSTATCCSHANEAPCRCPCASDCYCRQPGNTCDKRGQEPGWDAARTSDSPCLMEQFRKHQQTLPPSQRSAGAYLVCTCPKCRRTTL